MKINCDKVKLNNLSIKKVIEYLLYFLVFTLPIQTRYILSAWTKNGFSLEYTTISFYLTDFLIIILIILSLSVYFKTINLKIKNKLWYFLGILELFIITSIIISYNYHLALLHYFWFVLFVSLIWVLIKVKYDRFKLLLWFLTGSLLQAILGIIQFVTQSSFASKYLGMASHEAAYLGQAVIETFSGRWLRAYGGLDHPNIFGALMAISFLISIYFLLNLNKKIINFKELKVVLFFWTTSLLSFTGLILSFSRLAILATFIITVAMMIYYLFYKKYYIQVTKISLILIVLGLVLISLYSQLFFSRLDTSNRLEIKSINERQEQIMEAKMIIKDNLYLGVGIGNYSLALKEYYSDKSIYNLQPVHNSFLLLLAEIGIFGFVAFLIFFLYLFTLAFYRKDVIGLSLWFLLLFIMLAEHWLVSLHFGWLILSLVSGIILKRNKQLN